MSKKLKAKVMFKPLIVDELWTFFLCCLLLFLPAQLWAADDSPLHIVEPLCERTVNPLGLDIPVPRLGWKLLNAKAADRGQVQTAYHILVASSAEKLAAGTGDLWDSGKVLSNETVFVPYAGQKLTENEACYWRVQVWDRDGKSTPWSQQASWTMGLFGNASWKAQWISASGWTDYIVETHFKIIKEAASIYLRAHGAADSYMWQVNANEHCFRPHVRVSGGFQVLKSVPLEGDLTSSEHTLRIRAEGHTIDTFLDDRQIDTRTDDSHTSGEIGFRSSSTEVTLFKDVRVTDLKGNVLYSKDFRNGSDVPPGGTAGLEGMTIANGEAMIGTDPRTPRFRTEFSVDRPVRRAWIYAAAGGIYELSLNGTAVSDARFAPGWSNYRTRIEYQTYDVTLLLRQGRNAVGAQVTPGWYAGRIAWFGSNQYGDTPLLRAELHVNYTDGTSATFATDTSWQVGSGPVVAADSLDGEDYDARLEQPGWDKANFQGSGWHSAATALGLPNILMTSQVDPPMRIYKEFAPVAVTEPQPGVYVYKLPQDINGVTRVRIHGAADATVRLRHAELLNADGTLDLRTNTSPGIASHANNTDTYTFSKDGQVVFEPHFTWRGFQYVEVSGTLEKPALNDVTGLSIGTDVPVTGSLSTSNELINRIFDNLFWSGKDAYMSYPMDCPQRSERLGWAGDANFYLETADYNFDMDRFYSKWERDLLDSQSASGLMCHVSPSDWQGKGGGGYGGGWGDVGVCVPYRLWRTYGDIDLVRTSYEGMSRWVAYLESKSEGLIVPRTLADAGDWQQQEETSQSFCATTYFAFDVKAMAEMATALGKVEDAAHYRDLFSRIREAFAAKWIAPDGKVENGTQTAQAIALHLGLAPAQARAGVKSKLVTNLVLHQQRLTTGFVGTQWLLPALTDAGRTDLAYAVLEQKERPSWGYMVGMGSTTIWETWKVLNPDGTMNPGANSLNHCALGSCGGWMYNYIGGIAQEDDSAGFSRIVIHPQLGGGLSHAAASYESVHGTIKTDWKKNNGKFKLSVELPVNTTARIYIPASSPDVVSEGGGPAANASGVQVQDSVGGEAIFMVGAGKYDFVSGF